MFRFPKSLRPGGGRTKLTKPLPPSSLSHLQGQRLLGRFLSGNRAQKLLLTRLGPLRPLPLLPPAASLGLCTIPEGGRVLRRQQPSPGAKPFRHFLQQRGPQFGLAEATLAWQSNMKAAATRREAAAAAAACSSPSQAALERKTKQVKRTRSQAAKASEPERSVEGAGCGPGASQAGAAEAPPPLQRRESPPEPEEERLLQRWETEFREFLQAEDAAWEEQLLAELTPWTNPAAFLASFEQVAVACRWPRREWVTRLLPALSEEAEKAFVSLEAKDRGDFWKVKAAILRREALGRERKRQEFRRFCYQEANGPRDVCAQLQELGHTWLKAERSSKEQVLDLLVLEQFMSVLPKEMQNWVKEQAPDTCVQAVALAEDYLQRLQAAASSSEQEPAAVAGSQPKRGGARLEVAPLQVQVQRAVGEGSSAQQRTYPVGYRKARASKKKNMLWRRVEDTKLRARFPGRANTVFPRLSKQGGDVEERRHSERLRKSQPAPVQDAPAPRPLKKACTKLEKPAPLPQEALPDLTKTCLECGQHFSGLSSFMRHHVLHTGEKRHECCFCGKGFCWRSDLVRHECIHTGKMPHECAYCGQGFDRKWKRKQHEQDHLKSKALI